MYTRWLNVGASAPLVRAAAQAQKNVLFAEDSSSRGAASTSSPRRKPWVAGRIELDRNGAEGISHAPCVVRIVRVFCPFGAIPFSVASFPRLRRGLYSLRR